MTSYRVTSVRRLEQDDSAIRKLFREKSVKHSRISRKKTATRPGFFEKLLRARAGKSSKEDMDEQLFSASASNTSSLLLGKDS